ncbi:MAG: tRNA 2-selenouridine(34) synthase MnmH [Betaproteobacteria bacterium]|nr:tRNA 2-selenouridine(34) synthase MnmH [Betaproteobacteria bacterium]
MRTDTRDRDLATVAQLADFDEIIDTRSESEFAEDHVPGAVNFPVLNDEERVRVGTLYKQVSAFDAKKLGAALVSRNIAHHIETAFAQRPRTWRPLIYCWRGGSRSGALAHVLQQVGWRAARLEGGYKSFRRAVIDDLEVMPGRYSWRVVCGLTGSGKSRLLRALAASGAQVLDLEALAAHRGSVLGNLPDAPQPAQKMFESLVWSALRGFDRGQPVFVEAESKKIGNLRVPQTLIDAMWSSACVQLNATVDLRVEMLMDEYRHFVEDAPALGIQLDCLVSHYGRERIAAWKQRAADADWQTLVRELLEIHYDPAYTRSTLNHYPQLAQGPALTVMANNDEAFANAAAQCIADVARHSRHG